jgi:hypothetical protein
VKVSRFETGQIVVIVTQRRIVSLIFMENIENMMGLRGRMLKSPESRKASHAAGIAVDISCMRSADVQAQKG